MGGVYSTFGGEERYIQVVGRGNLRERDHWGDQSVDGRMILRWIFRKRDLGIWAGSSWLRIRTSGGQL